MLGIQPKQYVTILRGLPALKIHSNRSIMRSFFAKVLSRTFQSANKNNPRLTVSDGASWSVFCEFKVISKSYIAITKLHAMSCYMLYSLIKRLVCFVFRALKATLFTMKAISYIHTTLKAAKLSRLNTTPHAISKNVHIINDGNEWTHMLSSMWSNTRPMRRWKGKSQWKRNARRCYHLLTWFSVKFAFCQ